MRNYPSALVHVAERWTHPVPQRNRPSRPPRNVHAGHSAPPPRPPGGRGWTVAFAALVLLSAAPLTKAEWLAADAFDYPDGPLVVTPGVAWLTHSGSAGEANIVGGQVQLVETESEDIHHPLASPAGTALYACFRLTAVQLPSGSGSYFASFKGSAATMLRGKLFATTNGASPDTFRLAVANADSAAAVAIPFPRDLALDEASVVVLRYEPASTLTTLWLNPTAEADESVSGTDAATAAAIGAFAFRQPASTQAGIGRLTIDDWRVATTFDECLAGAPSLSQVKVHAEAAWLGEADREPARFTLTRTGSVDTELAVNVRLGGTTQAGQDFTAEATPAIIPTGQVQVTLSLPLLDDLEPEADETLVLEILAGPGYVVGNPASASVTLRDNDGPLPSQLLLQEPFDYPDGPVAEAAGTAWRTFSGASNQVRVAAGRLHLNPADTEDICADLAGDPVTPNAGGPLYARLTLDLADPPTGPGSYFACLKGTTATSFRARLFVTTNHSARGCFRVAVANGASSVNDAIELPVDLAQGQPCAVVLRYDPASAQTRLWVNPTRETDTSVVALDTANPLTIVSIAFRQAGGIGRLWVDDIKVGREFEDVCPVEIVAPATPGWSACRLTAPDSLVLELTGDAGQTYLLEGSCDLLVWEELDRVFLETSTAQVNVSVLPGEGGFFFRATLVPTQ